MSQVATGYDRAQLCQARAQRLASCEIRRPRHQNDLIDPRVGLEELKGPFQNGSSVALHEDLVDAAPHSCPLTPGHNDGGAPHRCASTRTRRCAASQKPIMSVIWACPPATRAWASVSASRSKTQGPVSWTSVSRGTVRRTLPSTTSFTVSLIGTATTPTASSPARLATGGERGLVWIRMCFASGASRRASWSRATNPGPGSTVRTAASATGSAAALDPPQRFRPPHARLAGRGGEDHPAGGRLQHRGNDHADRLVHVAPAVLDHNHGAVVQVCHALVLLFPLFDDLDVHLFTRDHHRFQRV